MAEWRYSAGRAPAIVDDGLVVVVVGEQAAQETLGRIGGGRGGSPSFVLLLDLLLGGRSIAELPSFFLALREGEGWRCAVRGSIELSVDGAAVVDGALAASWIETVVSDEAVLEVRVLAVDDDPWQPVGGDLTRVSALRREPDAVRDPGAPVVESSPGSELVARRGTAAPVPDPAATLLGSPEAMPLVEPPADAPAPVSRYDELFGELTVAGGVAAAAVVVEDADAEEPQGARFSTDTAIDFDDSAVAVTAILCAQRHPNPPERDTCWRCSSRLSSSSIVRVPRPSLGRLEFDDGRVIDVDRTVLVGRNPRAERTDAANLPLLVAVGGDTAGVSRTHARIFLDGWQVLIEDLRSTYGTSIVSRDGATRRLRPGQPEPVSGDTTIDLGGGCSFRLVGVP